MTSKELQKLADGLPEPEWPMVYFSFEGWNDWNIESLAELEKEGYEIRHAYSADQMRKYAAQAVAVRHPEHARV